MNSINKELVKLWVEALRSGKYKQGRKALRDKHNKYCCLGVLCDISKKDLKISWKEVTEDDVYSFKDSYGVLPDVMLGYLGLDCNNVLIKTSNSKIPIDKMEKIGIPGYNKKYISLITLNDRYKLSFEQIADIIEEEFLK